MNIVAKFNSKLNQSVIPQKRIVSRHDDSNRLQVCNLLESSWEWKVPLLSLDAFYSTTIMV